MPFRRHWILYVEDNEDDVVIVRQVLPAARYPVVWAPDAEAARERLATTRFDLVLLDHGLPDTNSLLFLEEIHGIDPRLPVIVLSGRHDDALVVSAGRKGAVAFLAKDEATADLEGAVEAALRAVPEGRTRPDEASRLYEALLEMMNEGCLLVDFDGVVTYANGAAGRMSGGSAEDLLGQPAESILDEATRKRFLEFHGSVGRAEDEASIQLEGRLRPVEEEWPTGRPVLLSVRAVATELGEGERCLLVLSDISELVASRNALRSRLAELERFQRLFVDREGRILELKEKLREYERRLGIESSSVSESTRRELERRIAEPGKTR